jgi:NADP-dependent 3-hydroxy acid dehydrogenase YdfG
MTRSETRDLAGTVVAITGASSGIGLASARALLDEGALVAVCARRKERLDALVSEYGDERVLAVGSDVRSSADNNRFIAATLERFGRLDSLIANAGIGMYGGILDGTDAEVAEMIDTNFAGTVWAVRAAVPALVDAAGGDIVIVASVAGMRGGGNEAVYAATKFAQVGLAGAIDRELRGSGIRVTAICPAAVHTEFAIGKGRTEADPWLDEVLQPADVAAAIATVLRQPRRMRTTLWAMWSMTESS